MTNNVILPVTVADTTSKGKWRHNIRTWSMIVLVVQNSALVLMMSYSRKTTGPLYSTTSCVFLMEGVKVLVCLGIVFYQSKFSTEAYFHTLYTSLFRSRIDSFKMLIPATIYAIQNNLLFVALSNLDAAVYQVTYQLKILTTAIFSVGMLGRELHRKQWFALLLLMFGVTLVQLELQQAGSSKTEGEHARSPFKGLLAVLLACFSSGFAGVYFEKVVKAPDSNIWIRNIQLGFFGMIFSFFAMLMQDGEVVMTKGMLYGYAWLVYGVVLVSALGGLVVAVVVKYADNILKGFATSLSIVLSSVLSFYISDAFPSLQFLSGAIVVLLSVYLYSLP